MSSAFLSCFILAQSTPVTRSNIALHELSIMLYPCFFLQLKLKKKKCYFKKKSLHVSQ